MQLGFMPGRAAANTIFILRHFKGKELTKKKNVYFAFVYFEKAFDLEPRDVVWLPLRKLGSEKWLVKIAEPMYRNAQSCVTFIYDFLIQVGLFKGLVLSPKLVIIVLEALSREIRSGCPEEQL